MSEFQKFRKKPVVIEAMLYDGDFELDWIGANDHVRSAGDGTGAMEIVTLEGVMRANLGDYIIKGVVGEFYPCKPDIFEATYESVEGTNE